MKILLDEYEVFASGSVLCRSNKPLTFELIEPGNLRNPEDQIFVQFHFARDDATKGSAITTEPVSPKRLIIRLINFHNYAPVSHFHPLKIGVLAKPISAPARELLVWVAVQLVAIGTVSEFCYSFQYTFALGEIVVEGGEQNAVQ